LCKLTFFQGVIEYLFALKNDDDNDQSNEGGTQSGALDDFDDTESNGNSKDKGGSDAGSKKDDEGELGDKEDEQGTFSDSATDQRRSDPDYAAAMKVIDSLNAQIAASTDEMQNRALRAAIAQIRRQMKQGNARQLRSMLYLVVPSFDGRIIGFAKYGFIRIPWDCLDWVAHVRKHAAERYGTSYKDMVIFM